MSKITTIIYPVASTLIAVVEATAVVLAVHYGFAGALTLAWYFGVLATVAVGATAIVIAGVLTVSTLFFTRRLPSGSLSRKLALNLPALIFFLAAVVSFADIFGFDRQFSAGEWSVAISAAVVTLVFYLRVSFLPIVVEISDRQ